MMFLWPIGLWVPFALAIILSGCQSVPKEILVEKVVERKIEIPNSLLTCSAEPVAG